MINTLPSPKTIKKAKQVGRGIGSGVGGHTTGRGTKGQRSRSGYTKARPGFEGGQNPLNRRLPVLRGDSKKARKRDFITSKVKNTPIALSLIADKVKGEEVVDFDKLVELKLVKPLTHKRVDIKVVFDKNIDKKISFRGLKISKTAIESVEKAGGSVE
jgi:large subunit ribosomal protein L15